MATTVYAAITETLTPLVGRPIAEICMRSCTVSLGKTADSLTPEDLPQIARTIRESLGSLTTQALLDGAIEEINRKVQQIPY
jgi:hypothetical protein